MKVFLLERGNGRYFVDDFAFVASAVHVVAIVMRYMSLECRDCFKVLKFERTGFSSVGVTQGYRAWRGMLPQAQERHRCVQSTLEFVCSHFIGPVAETVAQC